jgi:general secretion pathway protein M
MISAPLRKFLAIALLVVVVFLAWELVIRPVVGEFAEYERTVAQNSELIDRYRAVAAERAPLEKERDRLKQEIESRSGLLAGTNPALIGAGLQDQIKNVVSAHGGKLQSAQILTPASEKELTRVSVRVVMSSELAALQKIIYDLETASPYLFIDDVDFRKRVTRRRQPGVRAEGDEQLTVRITVYGYVRS